MKRDMDLIRQIVMAVRDNPGPHLITSIEGVESEVYVEHARLLDEAGLVEATIIDDIHGVSGLATINRLTWSGHDFADAIESDTVWEKAKGTAKQAGGWTFGILLDIAKLEIKRRIGMAD